MSRPASEQQGDVSEEIYEEIEEEPRKSNGLIYNTIYDVGEKFAGTYIGQYMTGKIDRLLKLIEDTAKWSLPQDNDKNDSKEPLERPLPWIPFIALILALRLMRISLSITWLLIGNSPILPIDVVYFIQTRRRKLRAIRITGMRDIRKKEQARGKKMGLISKLRSILSVVVCKPGKDASTIFEQQNTFERPSNNRNNETDLKEKPLSYKRKAPDESCSDQDLTLDQIIDKYGNVSSDDDSDFNPPGNLSNKESSSSDSSSLTTSDDNDGDESVQIQHTMNTKNLKSEAGLSRDIKKHQIAENFMDNKSVNIKENGQYVDKQSNKPVPMPKPHKHAPVPVPIQEIKQEPIESDEESRVSKLPESEKTGCPSKQIDQEQKSVVASNDKSMETYNKHDEIENVNGDQKSQIGQTPEELFLTPATSTEDMFFSPVGSPNSSSSFGFQPTSILKNSSAVYLEKRSPELMYQEQIPKTEMANQDHMTAKRESATQQNPRGGTCYSGKPNKNKLRGKKR